MFVIVLCWFVWVVFEETNCHIILTFIFEYDPITCCWDITRLLFLSHLPLEVVFIWGIWQLWFCHLSWSLSLEWLLKYSTFYILRNAFIGSHLPLSHLKTFVLPSKFKFKFWVWSSQGLLIFWGGPPLEVVFIRDIWKLCLHLKDLSMI